MCGGLDFNGQQATSRFNHEVHLLADCRAPVEDPGVVEPRIPPGQQVM